ncbi:MAG TPA: PolC-type DNA polymerase III, partial [Bacillota bacterium]|nr:PolC-type DNA polymerase III [Bacillota bacterium]
KKYISYKTLHAIEDALKEKVHGIGNIVVKLAADMSLEDVTNEFDIIWLDLIEGMKSNMPAVSTVLNLCNYEIKQNVLLVSVVQASNASILHNKSVQVNMEHWFLDTFGMSFKVRFKNESIESTPTSNQYLVEKEKEDSMLARQMLENNSIQRPNKHGGNNKSNSLPILLGKRIKNTLDSIEDLREDSGRVAIEGKIFSKESRQLRGGKYLAIMDVTNYSGSVTVKLFLDAKRAKTLLDKLVIDKWYRIRGECQYDRYQREIVILANDINLAADRIRLDSAPVKRVELHLHTQMSSLDAIASAKSLIDRAAFWGHDAIAITDHGVVQAFPEAYAQGQKKGIKILLGVEAYLINDLAPIVTNSTDTDFNQDYVVLDIETTGLDFRASEIIEIGAVKIRDRKIVDTFSSIVCPKAQIPANITKLTGISDNMVVDAPEIESVLPRFLEFCGSSVLVAHNAPFDIGFINEKGKGINARLANPILDTLSLSRELLRDIKRFRLDTVAGHLGIVMKNHHRALEDAQVTAQILLKLLSRLEKDGIHDLNQINDAFSRRTNLNALKSFHTVILAKNQQGLKNLYKLISKSHMEYYYRRPRVPKSLLTEHREGLIIGSGCEAGELYRAIIERASKEEVEGIVDFYDYLEIQPLGNNDYLIRNEHVADKEALMNINREIVGLGKSYNKRVVATGDVHFLDPQDEYFRRILMSGQKFHDADNQPPLYFKTTDEMLDEFSYLGEEQAYSVVVEAPRSIADEIQELKPIPDQLFPPEIPGAEEEVRKMALKNAQDLYGNPLPDIVEKRLTKELDSIIGNGYAVLYLVAHKLVKKSLDDGYLVGSRGSVGSSFVATMTGVTEVNPLPPHYLCLKCQHSDFNIDKGKYACGIDLPHKECIKCGSQYDKLGHDIPFEVFLGFKGDKVPDIDLNFSGEYQSIAHKYTEELFGEGYVFRAGTIGRIADKTAFGFVMKYMEGKQIIATNSEIKRLVAGCAGVKRTTGQHPGGILVVPKDRDIHDFTPIQYPADDKESATITSHFDFHSIHDTLVKLDILGHDDPTVIRMLEDLTGINAMEIPIGEERTMKIFSDTESLGISPDDINSPVGTFGIPEFGTRFVRQMLVDTRPTTFADLIRISGLSHGTDVWLNNAQELIKKNIIGLSEVISTRDDIMIYLMYQGMEPTISFNIMERVRRGKGLTPEMEDEMNTHGIPQWYIESCKKIKYMFPKAHASAYVLMAFRIAYFKVHYPEAFYATYFTVRADDFDAALIISGQSAIKTRIKYLGDQGNKLTAKERNLQTILEVVVEMYARGYKFAPIDLYKSSASKFLLTDDGILPSLNALQGVGVNAANSIVKARQVGDFISVEDLRERARVTKTVIEALKLNNVLADLPEASQISLF